MKLHALALAATLVVAAIAGVTPAVAGGFTYQQGCDTLGTEPLRIILWLGLYNTRNYGDLCAVRVEPIALNGVPINPILDCIAPSELVCSIDSAGVAIFSAVPCLPSDSWVTSVDSLGMVVGAPAGNYRADLIIPGGVIRATDLLQYDCGPSGTLDVPPQGPQALYLAPPEPNPAGSAGATFRFGLPRESKVALTVFDELGRRVRDLADGVLPSGEQSLRWDGRDWAGRAATSGVYFARLEALGRTLRVRFVLVR